MVRRTTRTEDATARVTAIIERRRGPVGAVIATVAAVALAAAVLHGVAIFATVVRSGSMRPTLRPGDVLLTVRVHRSTPVRRGEIVVFASGERGGDLVKRVIGLPGERVEIRGAAVQVDGAPLIERYARGGGAYRGTFAVPDRAYLLLGDDRDASEDARSWDDPYVRRGDLRGVVVARLLRTGPAPTAGTAVR